MCRMITWTICKEMKCDYNYCKKQGLGGGFFSVMRKKELL